MNVQRTDGTGPAGAAGRRGSWPARRSWPTTGAEDRRHVEADAERR